MSWLPILFAIIVVLIMIILGYYLTRNFLREYTYDVPSKTQSKRALFSRRRATLLAAGILAREVYAKNWEPRS